MNIINNQKSNPVTPIRIQIAICVAALLSVILINYSDAAKNRAADLDPLTVADLNVGDYLEIRGAEFPAGSGTILATILERQDVDPDTILQGFVETVNDPALTILGVTIETNGAIFRDVDDSILTATEFFNLVDVNSLVKAKGTESSVSVITATEVEFELEL